MGASVGGTVRHLVSGHDGVVVSSAAAPDWPALRAAVWGRVMAPRPALLQPTTWEPDYAPTLPATLVVPTTQAGPDGWVVWIAPAAYTVACGASVGNVITACCGDDAACHGGNYTVLVDGALWRVDTGPAATVLAAIPALSARCGDDWVGHIAAQAPVRKRGRLPFRPGRDDKGDARRGPPSPAAPPRRRSGLRRPELGSGPAPRGCGRGGPRPSSTAPTSPAGGFAR